MDATTVPPSEGERSEAGGTAGSRSALIVPMRRGNRPEGPRRGEEGRRDTGLLEGKTTGTPISDTVSTKLQRIAGLARESPERAFVSLAHHIDYAPGTRTKNPCSAERDDS